VRPIRGAASLARVVPMTTTDWIIDLALILIVLRQIREAA
jgi:hypothetical protein